MQQQATCGCGCGQITNVVGGVPNRYVRGHNWKGIRRDPTPRYKEEDRGYETPCWVWQRTLDHNGYPRDGGRHAHRLSYIEHVGPIPAGHELHHLCRVRACVNPAHLLPVTRAEHVRLEGAALRTHCPQGHPYDATNTYTFPRTGHRKCRQCRREGMRRAKAAKKS